jgi:hypothetical protein
MDVKAIGWRRRMVENLVLVVCGLYGLIIFMYINYKIDLVKAATWYQWVVVASWIMMIANVVVGIIAMVFNWSAIEGASHQFGTLGFVSILIGYLIAKPPFKEKAQEEPECCRKGYCGSSRCGGCCGR